MCVCLSKFTCKHTACHYGNCGAEKEKRTCAEKGWNASAPVWTGLADHAMEGCLNQEKNFKSIRMHSFVKHLFRFHCINVKNCWVNAIVSALPTLSKYKRHNCNMILSEWLLECMTTYVKLNMKFPSNSMLR